MQEFYIHRLETDQIEHLSDNIKAKCLINEYDYVQLLTYLAQLDSEESNVYDCQNKIEWTQIPKSNEFCMYINVICGKESDEIIATYDNEIYILSRFVPETPSDQRYMSQCNQLITQIKINISKDELFKNPFGKIIDKYIYPVELLPIADMLDTLDDNLKKRIEIQKKFKKSDKISADIQDIDNNKEYEKDVLERIEQENQYIKVLEDLCRNCVANTTMQQTIMQQMQYQINNLHQTVSYISSKLDQIDGYHAYYDEMWRHNE